MNDPVRRLRILCFFFGIWILLCAALLVRSTVFRRDELREKSERISWRTGVIPVLRGRILDKSGLPLAWTETEKDAMLESLPASSRRKETLLRELKEQFRFELKDPASFPRTVIRDLSPGQMESWVRLLRRYPSSLSLRTRILRKRVEYVSVRTVLGECRTDKDGIQIGISGLEKEYEPRLAGRPGRFRVMLDRNGRWMPESLRIEDPGEPGKDVILNNDLRDMTGEEAVRHDH